MGSKNSWPTVPCGFQIDDLVSFLEIDALLWGSKITDLILGSNRWPSFSGWNIKHILVSSSTVVKIDALNVLK